MEIFNDGEKPYAGMDNAAVINKVQAGYRAPKPAECSQMMYTIMLATWAEKAKARPPFSVLVDMITPMVPQGTNAADTHVDASVAKHEEKHGHSSKNTLAQPVESSSDPQSGEDYVDMTGYEKANALNEKSHAMAKRKSVKKRWHVSKERLSQGTVSKSTDDSDHDGSAGFTSINAYANGSTKGSASNNADYHNLPEKKKTQLENKTKKLTKKKKVTGTTEENSYITVATIADNTAAGVGGEERKKKRKKKKKAANNDEEDSYLTVSAVPDIGSGGERKKKEKKKKEASPVEEEEVLGFESDF